MKVVRIKLQKTPNIYLCLLTRGIRFLCMNVRSLGTWKPWGRHSRRQRREFNPAKDQLESNPATEGHRFAVWHRLTPNHPTWEGTMFEVHLIAVLVKPKKTTFGLHSHTQMRSILCEKRSRLLTAGRGGVKRALAYLAGVPGSIPRASYSPGGMPSMKRSDPWLTVRDALNCKQTAVKTSKCFAICEGSLYRLCSSSWSSAGKLNGQPCNDCYFQVLCPTSK